MLEASWKRRCSFFNAKSVALPSLMRPRVHFGSSVVMPGEGLVESPQRPSTCYSLEERWETRYSPIYRQMCHTGTT